jgi:hypothetical protein
MGNADPPSLDPPDLSATNPPLLWPDNLPGRFMTRGARDLRGFFDLNRLCSSEPHSFLWKFWS